MEFSGTLIIDRLKGYEKALNLGDMSAIIDFLKYLPGDPAFYAKGTIEVENGQVVNTDITEFKLGNTHTYQSGTG